MTNWTRQVRHQIKLLVGQIADASNKGGSLGDAATDVYYKMLETLIEQDLRLAELRDNSDLVLRMEGEAFDDDPSIQLITSIFGNVTTQVTDLTKAILGIAAEGKVTPKAVDLGLSGMARGSLYFGVKAQTSDKKGALLGETDTLHVSTRQALRVIDDVAHAVESHPEKISIEEVSEVVDDPRVRDAALVAVQRLSPSGRRGIESVTVSGERGTPAELTPEHRRAIRESLFKPVIVGAPIELEGYVREVDLDSRRFDLRNIVNQELRDVRCAFRDIHGLNLRQLLGARIKVRGLVERTRDDIPRLMSITDIEVLDRVPREFD